MARHTVDDAVQRGVLLEKSLEVERYRFQGTLHIAMLGDAKSVRQQELIDAQSTPLHDMDELMKMSRL